MCLLNIQTNLCWKWVQLWSIVAWSNYQTIHTRGNSFNLSHLFFFLVAGLRIDKKANISIHLQDAMMKQEFLPTYAWKWEQYWCVALLTVVYYVFYINVFLWAPVLPTDQRPVFFKRGANISERTRGPSCAHKRKDKHQEKSDGQRTIQWVRIKCLIYTSITCCKGSYANLHNNKTGKTTLSKQHTQSSSLIRHAVYYNHSRICTLMKRTTRWRPCKRVGGLGVSCKQHQRIKMTPEACIWMHTHTHAQGIHKNSQRYFPQGHKRKNVH